MALLTNIILAIYALNLVQIDTQSTEEDQPFTNIYNPFVPSSVNFQDIYTNTLNRLANAPTSEEQTDFPINSLSSQFVQFHPKVLKISRITAPPKVLLNSSFIKKSTEESTTSHITEESDEPIKVIPIIHHQKGVLDVLFPAARVKSFKNVFDSFRRILSYTFR
ncbi:unnamed protein product, partial [Brenthis ino]